MEGWIKMWRKLLDWRWFHDSKMVHFYVYLLLKASHNTYFFKGKKLKPGQLPFGYRSASSATNLSIQNLRTCIKRLKSTHEITIESTPQGSIITIPQWSEYQESTHDLTNNQQTINTNQEIKEIKEKNISQNQTLRKDLEKVYAAYPRKEGKTPGINYLIKHESKNENLLTDLKIAIENYSNAKIDTEKIYKLKFSNFVKEWRDWINYESETKENNRALLRLLGEKDYV